MMVIGYGEILINNGENNFEYYFHHY